MTPVPIPNAAGDARRVLHEVSVLVGETHPGRKIAVTLDSDFERDLGLDSLGRAELMLRIGQVFGTSLPDEALAEVRTARELLPYLGHRPAAFAAERSAAPRLEASASGVPLEAQTLPDVLDWHAARHPDRLHVLLYGEGEHTEEISYGALRDEARRIASGLVGRGLQPRQSVALMLPTSRDYLACFFGVMLAGGVPVPIYPPARLSQIEDHLRRHARILDNAQCVLIITVPQAKTVALLLRAAAPTLRDIVAPHELRQPAVPIAYRPGPEDLAFLQYTSGSTGDPKGVMLTHANLLANLRAMGDAARVGGADVAVSWLPLYHDMGLIGLWFCPLYYGCPLVLMSPLAFLSRPSRWLQTISRHRGTISAAPNFAYELCARKVSDAELEGVDLSSWRLALNGAEPVSPQTIEAFAARFGAWGFQRGAVFPAFGLAECCVGLAFPPLGRGPFVDHVSRRILAEERRAAPVAAGSAEALPVVGCGHAIPHHALRVVDDRGEELPDRQVGRLQFRGPSATAGYFRNPEATKKLIAGDWLETGDLAYLAEGELFLTGRLKDIIIRGGRNIYPYELEQAVGALPGMRKGCVAVFGSADPHNGTERLVVLAETRESDINAREQLRSRINELAADLTGLPVDDVVLAPPHTVLKTSSGKIRRAASRELYEAGLVGAATVPMWRTLARLAVGGAVARARARGKTLRGWLFGLYAWSVFLAVAFPLWCIVAATQRPSFGRRACHRAARLLLWVLGAPWQAIHLSRLPAREHVLAANHGSYLDALYLIAALPPDFAYRFVAKREFTSRWVPRLFLQGIGCLFVERFDARRGVADVEAMAEALARGERLVVFPEGTFSRESGLRPLRTGAFVAAARANAPVVAAGLRGVRAVLREGATLPRREPVAFEIGATLAPTGADWAAAMRLRDGVRAEILRLCGEPDLSVR